MSSPAQSAASGLWTSPIFPVGVGNETWLSSLDSARYLMSLSVFWQPSSRVLGFEDVMLHVPGVRKCLKYAH